MKLLTTVLVTILMKCEAGEEGGSLFWDKKQYLQVIDVKPTVPGLEVKEVYKRSCCGPRTLEQMPIRSDTDIKGEWEKEQSWKHTAQQQYTLDCFKSLKSKGKYLARVRDPAMILMELLVSNCEKVREVVKIHKKGHNYSTKKDYHNISINNVKHPRVDPSKLRDNTIEDNSSSHEAFGAKKKERRDHYKCVHFEIYEKNDNEGDCEEGITFDPADWAK